jgi:hypothetical protein
VAEAVSCLGDAAQNALSTGNVGLAAEKARIGARTLSALTALDEGYLCTGQVLKKNEDGTVSFVPSCRNPRLGRDLFEFLTFSEQESPKVMVDEDGDRFKYLTCSQGSLEVMVDEDDVEKAADAGEDADDGTETEIEQAFAESYVQNCRFHPQTTRLAHLICGNRSEATGKQSFKKLKEVTDYRAAIELEKKGFDSPSILGVTLLTTATQQR